MKNMDETSAKSIPSNPSNSIFPMIKHRLLNDIRTESFEICIKIFHAPNLFIRMFLLVFVCISAGLASYTVISSFMSYFAYQVITTSRTLYETPTLFPKITICPSNFFQTSYALEILKEANRQFNPNISLLNDDQMKLLDFQTAQTLIFDISLMANGIVISKNFSDDNRKLLSHNLDDVLLRCKFNFQNCTSADFLWYFDSYYGNCYIFNSGFNSTGHPVDLKQSSVAGLISGLQLEWYVNFNESLKYFRYRGMGSGLVLRIDNSSYLTDHNLDGIKVAPGFNTDIAINRAFKFTLPSPYSNCEIDASSPKTSDSELFNLIAQSNYEYTQQLCFLQCFQKEVIKECGCSANSFLSFFSGASQCQTPTEVACYLNLFTYKYMTSNFISSNCIPLCPLECNSTKFTTSERINDFDGDTYMDYIQQNPRLVSDFAMQPIDAAQASASIVSLNVFYDSLSYEYLEESPQMDIVALLANIGGNLGLFLGVSLLSVCELVEIIAEILLIKLKRQVRP